MYFGVMFKFDDSSQTIDLGGGFMFFYFHLLPGEMIQFDQYVSNGLKSPASDLRDGFYGELVDIACDYQFESHSC